MRAIFALMFFLKSPAMSANPSADSNAIFSNVAVAFLKAALSAAYALEPITAIVAMMATV